MAYAAAVCRAARVSYQVLRGEEISIKLCVIHIMRLVADSNCHTEKACRCHAGRQEIFIAAMMLYAAANACIGATPAAYAADVMPQSVSGFGLGIYRCAGDIGMVHLLLMHIVVSCNLSSNCFCNILRTGHMAFCLCRMLHKTASKCNGGRIHPSCSISETAPPLV